MLFVTTMYLKNAGAKERLDAYSNAGFLLANHSHSHQSPTKIPLEKYIADINQADELLKNRKGFVPFYRFPFLQHGNTKESRDRLREHLASTGYKIGYVTVDNLDWYMNSLLQQALAKGQHVDYEKLGELYVEVMTQAVTFYDDIAIKYLNRSPKHTLLLHENDITALFIGDLITALKRNNWRIISANDAFTDPIAAELPDVIHQGQGRVTAIATSKGANAEDMRNYLENTDNIDALFTKRKVFSNKPLISK